MSDHPTIGASQISAILGVPGCPNNIHQVWQQLVHGIKQEDNEAMARGREWEPDILAKYERLTGRKVIPNRGPDGKQVSKVRGYLHATPDGSAAHDLGQIGLEAKTSAVAWSTLPAYYYNQAQVQMYCWSSFSRVDVPVMFSFFGFKIFEDIQPDLELQERMQSAAEKFIKDYVLTRKLPPIDHTDACRGAIIAQWPTEKSETYLEADEVIDGLLEDLLGVQKKSDELKAALEYGKNDLRACITDHAGIKSKFARVDFKYQNGRQTTDYEEIIKLLKPKLSKANLKRLDKLMLQHTKKSGSRHLRIYWNKGGDDDQAAAQIADSVHRLGDSEPASEPQG